MHNNVRTLFPPIRGDIPTGGGSDSEHIQKDTLPTPALDEKDKIYQYVGTTTADYTNGYFYKCVEATAYDWEETTESASAIEVEVLPTASAETLGNVYLYDSKYYHTVIVLSYSWVQTNTQPTVASTGVTLETVETVTADGTKTYKQLLGSFSNITSFLSSNDVYVLFYDDKNVEEFVYIMPLVARNSSTLRFMCEVPNWGGSSMGAKLVSGAISTDPDYCTFINGGDLTVNTPSAGVTFTLKKYS